VGGMDNAKINYDDAGSSFVPGLESNILYIFTNNIYVITMVAYNISKPWREGFYTNLPLMIMIGLALLYNHIILFWAEGTWVLLFDSKWLPDYNSRWVIFGASWGFGLIIYFLQKVVFEPTSNWLVKKYPQHKWL
jgi:hypothetical protein